jgi:putative membrane protein
MAAWLAPAYDWFKAAHIIFVIFWMAGLFIFPRYLIHHQDALARPDEAARWVEREARLRRIILTPALIAVWLFGLLLAAGGEWWASGWLHAKIALVVGLSGFHGWAVGYARKLGQGRATLPDRRLRMLNELPALGVVLIVWLVVLKPF